MQALIIPRSLVRSQPGPPRTCCSELANASASAPIDSYGQLWVDADAESLRSGRGIGWEVDTWPAHWLAAQGIAAGDLEARGATATVAEVLAARNVGPMVERVHVQIIRLHGMTGESIVTVSDGSGSMVLRWPVEAGPAQAQTGRSFELEVRSDPSLCSYPRHQTEAVRALEEASRRALRGDLEGTQRAVANLREATQRQGVDGEVIAARRLQGSHR